MPMSVMEEINWSCPHCRGVCFAGACRKDPKQTPYEPKGTLLGHDTKRVADARSIESLVDFSVSNLNWLRDDDDAVESARIRRAREEAQRAKEIDPQGEDDEDRDDVEDTQVHFEYSPDGTPAGTQNRHYAADQDSYAIDPALQEDADLIHSLSRANKTLPPPSAMLRGARPGDNTSPGDAGPSSSYVPEGYAPATTGGFVAPPAVMYQQNGETNDYSYPDPEDVSRPEVDDGDYQPQTKSRFRPFKRPSKRSRDNDGDDQIHMDAHPKKCRISEDPSLALNRPRNEATKQFEKEKERKALEEAKKQGRFIAVQAALKGRRRLVKLRVPGARLAQILARQATRHIQPAPVASAAVEGTQAPEETILVRSDIAPTNEKTRKRATNSKMKVRVEKDEDFSMRRDRHQRNETKRKHIDYEEVDVATDDESDDTAGRDRLKASTDRSNDVGNRRRVSSYIQRKHQDDPHLPDELPENFKDSRPRTQPLVPRPGPVERARARLEAQKTASASRATRMSVDSSNGEEEEEEDAEAEEGAPTTITTEEANRRAKLQALRMLEDLSLIHI